MSTKQNRASTAADQSSRSGWKARQRAAGQRRRPEVDLGPVLGGADCWCGAPYGHDWPGRDDGAPHPRGT